jgi:hypothetical protein
MSFLDRCPQAHRRRWADECKLVARTTEPEDPASTLPAAAAWAKVMNLDRYDLS